MPTFSMARDREWAPRPDTPGWERCGLYNDKRDPSERKASYTTLNRVGAGGKVSNYSVEWDWEIYVLEGELVIGGVWLGPHDHAVIAARESFSCEAPQGCVLLTVGHLGRCSF